jgi:hypothetical protein
VNWKSHGGTCETAGELMTIDERLEAIAQHVEILGKMQLKTEEELQQLGRQNDQRGREVRQLGTEVRRLGRFVRFGLRLLIDHEGRLAALEDDDGAGDNLHRVNSDSECRRI